MFFAPLGLATKYNYLDDKFRAAYKWLAETDLDHTPVGSYPVCDGVTANVQEYDTFPASEGSFETHDAYFDIQYVISGKEQFGYCKREGLVLKQDVPENDVKFYEEPALSGRRAGCCPATSSSSRPRTPTSPAAPPARPSSCARSSSRSKSDPQREPQPPTDTAVACQRPTAAPAAALRPETGGA